jgi:hypothetical protein
MLVDKVIGRDRIAPSYAPFKQRRWLWDSVSVAGASVLEDA